MQVIRIPNSHYYNLSTEDVAAINRLLSQLKSDAIAVTLGEIRFVIRRNTSLFVCRDVESPIERGPIVGMASLAVEHLLTGRKGRVEDVVVDEAHRRRGIAKSLMREIIRQGHVERLRCLDLTSAPSREAANAMYIELGFEKRDTNAYRLNL